MEAVNSSEMSMNFCRITLGHIKEDVAVNIYGYENIRFNIVRGVLYTSNA
jgi:hypothetical protein